jgi:hypothetical protein
LEPSRATARLALDAHVLERVRALYGGAAARDHKTPPAP